MKRSSKNYDKSKKFPGTGRKSATTDQSSLNHNPNRKVIRLKHQGSKHSDINSMDSTFTKICDDDTIRVVSRRDEITAGAGITARVPSKVVCMRFHFAEGAACTLTSSAIDPVAKIPE